MAAKLLRWGILAALAVFSSGAWAQLEALPGELLAADRQDLEGQRSSLLQRREALRASIGAHDAKCGTVAENSPLVAECSSGQAALAAEIKRYQEALAEFTRLLGEKLAHAKERRTQCAAAGRQADMDRRQIEKLRDTTEASQQELADWSRLNEQAQKKALVAAAKFTLGEFTANIEGARSTVSKLERHAAFLAKKAEQSRKYKTRMKYAAQLEATLADLEPKQLGLMAQEIVKAGLTADKTWNLVRNTIHHEAGVARNRNAAVREMLRDPEFKEAFAGGDLDTPGLDVLASLTQTAGEELGKLELGLERYGKFTGPAIRAAVFVRDASYSALLSGLSTQRVLQQNDLAGDLARATASLQAQYKRSIDAVRASRQAGLGA
jgi:hypothetical protein